MRLDAVERSDLTASLVDHLLDHVPVDGGPAMEYVAGNREGLQGREFRSGLAREIAGSCERLLALRRPVVANANLAHHRWRLGAVAGRRDRDRASGAVQRRPRVVGEPDATEQPTSRGADHEQICPNRLGDLVQTPTDRRGAAPAEVRPDAGLGGGPLEQLARVLASRIHPGIPPHSRPDLVLDEDMSERQFTAGSQQRLGQSDRVSTTLTLINTNHDVLEHCDPPS